MYYGILFDVSRLGKKILLKPSYLIKGGMDEGVLYDEYSNTYHLLNHINQVNSNNKLFGFPIADYEIKKCFKNLGYENYEYIDLCAGIYKEICEQFIFILENNNNNNKMSCYAINLLDKTSMKVNLKENLFSQINIDFNNKNLNNRNNNRVVTDEAVEEIPDEEGYVLNTDFIYKKVTSRVIGQDAAVQSVIRTISRNLKYANYESMKSNILLYGPSGCGKTEIVRSIAKECKVPVLIEDMSNYTANGYVGDSVKTILKRLYLASNRDMSKAEHGIVMLDEFDKLTSINPRETVNKTDVQEDLLKIVEGGSFNINDSNKTDKQLIMNTDNITFIFAGAFGRVADKHKEVLGFTNNNYDSVLEKTMTRQDLKDYGIIPEMISRISLLVPIKKLKTIDLEHILARSSISSLKIYERALWEEDNVKVIYANKYAFIKKMAMEAAKEDMGARGLKSVVDRVFEPAVAAIGNMDRNCPKELIMSNDVFSDSNNFVLKKVKRGQNELSKGIRESHF